MKDDRRKRNKEMWEATYWFISLIAILTIMALFLLGGAK